MLAVSMRKYRPTRLRTKQRLLVTFPETTRPCGACSLSVPTDLLAKRSLPSLNFVERLAYTLLTRERYFLPFIANATDNGATAANPLGS